MESALERPRLGRRDICRHRLRSRRGRNVLTWALAGNLRSGWYAFESCKRAEQMVELASLNGCRPGYPFLATCTCAAMERDSPFDKSRRLAQPVHGGKTRWLTLAVEVLLGWIARRRPLLLSAL